jgi:hypothetical protein
MRAKKIRDRHEVFAILLSLIFLKDVIPSSARDLAWSIETLATARQILRPTGLRMTSSKEASDRGL